MTCLRCALTVISLVPGSPLLASDLKRQLFTHPGLISTEVVLPDLQNSLLVGTRTFAG